MSNIKSPVFRWLKEDITIVLLFNSVNIILCYESRELDLFFLKKFFNIWKLQPKVEIGLVNISTSKSLFRIACFDCAIMK